MFNNTEGKLAGLQVQIDSLAQELGYVHSKLDKAEHYLFRGTGDDSIDTKVNRTIGKLTEVEERQNDLIIKLTGLSNTIQDLTKVSSSLVTFARLGLAALIIVYPAILITFSFVIDTRIEKSNQAQRDQIIQLLTSHKLVDKP
jgi:hypothetical protein